jgi:formiminotetrahydrofolate cyclodeaminase
VSLLDLPVSGLLDRLASPDPTPGGGSAAALAGATGGALVAMVCATPKTRSGDPAERARLDSALKETEEASARLRSLVDQDKAAYDGVMAAYRLPKGTESEKASRKEAIAAALVGATDVPLTTAAECLRVLRAAEEAAAAGNPNMLSDARTGAALALAGLLGAAENVRINAPGESEAVRRARTMVEDGLKRALAAGLPGMRSNS